MSRRLRSALLAPFALLGLAACGGGGSSTGGTTPEGIDVAVYAVDGVAWNNTTYRATATDGEVTIYGENGSSIVHNLHIQNDDGTAAAEEFIDLPSRGASGTITVALAPGEYRIVCLIPGHQGMNSLLVVS